MSNFLLVYVDSVDSVDSTIILYFFSISTSKWILLVDGFCGVLRDPTLEARSGHLHRSAGGDPRRPQFLW